MVCGRAGRAGQWSQRIRLCRPRLGIWLLFQGPLDGMGLSSGGVVWSNLCFRRTGCSGGVGPGRPRGSLAAMGRMQGPVRMWVDWLGRTGVEEKSPSWGLMVWAWTARQVMVTLGEVGKTGREGGAVKE